MGGARAFGVVTIAVGALLCLLLLLPNLPALRLARGSTLFFAALLSAFVWTGLQILPLPCDWVGAVSPTSHLHQLRSSWLLDNRPPSFCSLSYDSAATREEWLKLSTALAVFAGALVFARRGHRRAIVQLVAGSALLMALVGLAHRALGAERLFGLYLPQHAKPPLLTPLLNPNHLAGLLLLGSTLWLGLSVSRQSSERRPLFIAAALLCFGATLATQSRAGIAALGFAASAFLLMVLLRGRQRGEAVKLPQLLLLSTMGALGLGAVLYAALEPLREEVERADLSKLELISLAADFCHRAPWVGVGRGAFSSAFVAHWGTRFRMRYPENIALQWVSEWGLPFTLLFFALNVWAFLHLLRTRTSAMQLATLLGLCALFLHNLLDFNLEMLPLKVACAALLASLCAVPDEAESAGEEASGWSVRRLAQATTGLGLVAGLITLPWLSHYRLDTLEARLQRLGDYGAQMALLRSNMRGHPAEPEVSLIAGRLAVQKGKGEALRWLARTMELAPRWDTPHLLAAYSMRVHRRRAQALVEIRAAAELDPLPAARVLCHLYPKGLAFEEALSAAPPRGEARWAFLHAAERCADAKEPLAQQLEDYVVQKAPEPPADLSARYLDRLLRNKEPERAEAEARRILRKDSERDEAWLLLASVLGQVGKSEEAHAILVRLEARSGKRWEVLRLRAEIAAAEKDDASLQKALDGLRQLAAGRVDNLIEIYLFSAGLEEKRGRPHRALQSLEEAYRLDERVDILQRIDAIATRAGERSRANLARHKLCHEHGVSSYCEVLPH